MSRQIQIRRGTAVEHATFTGAIGEITMDTTNKTLRVHDGTTAGGTVLAKQSEIPDLTNADYVIESQLPTAQNNYTWYRKYKSGWIEQGGIDTSDTSAKTVTLPIEMADTNYATSITCQTLGNYFYFCKPNSTTEIQFRVNSAADLQPASGKTVCWSVKGLKAA